MENLSNDLPNVGVVGPGLVGDKLINYFYENGTPGVAQVTRVFASERSDGQPYRLPDDKVITLELASEADYSGLDIVCNAAPAGFASEHADRIADQVDWFVDASSDLRKDPDVPLIIPEINPEVVNQATKNILAKPNCTTTMGSLAVYALHEAASLRSLAASTYQSVSGQGWKGLREFDLHNRYMQRVNRYHALLNGNWGKSRPPVPTVFPEPTAFNVAPHAGTFEGPDTTEELKYKNETRKIFGFGEEVAIDVTCVRVPVRNGHSVDIHAQFDDELTAHDAKDILAETPGVKLHDDWEIPQPINIVGTNEVHVGRVRQSELFGKNGLRLWAVGDNLTVGAAHNIFKTVRLLASQK